MVPVERIGLSTSPLPRERSTTEPHRRELTLFMRFCFKSQAKNLYGDHILIFYGFVVRGRLKMMIMKKRP